MARRGKPPGPPKPPKRPTLKVVPGTPDKDGTRATGVELEQRLDQVETWDLEGIPYREIIRLGVALWKVQPRQIDRYIAMVRDRYVERHLADRRKARARRVVRLETLAARAAAIAEYGTAVSAERAAARIEGSIFHPELDADEVPDDGSFAVDWGAPDLIGDDA